MGRFLHFFGGTASKQNHDAIYEGTGYTEPWVAYVDDEENPILSWNKAKEIVFDDCMFCRYALSDVSIMSAATRMYFEELPDLSNVEVGPGERVYTIYFKDEDTGGSGGTLKAANSNEATLPSSTFRYRNGKWNYVNDDDNLIPMDTVDEMNDIIVSKGIFAALKAGLPSGYILSDNAGQACAFGLKLAFEEDNLGSMKRLGDMDGGSWGQFFSVMGSKEGLPSNNEDGNTYFTIRISFGNTCGDSDEGLYRYNASSDIFEYGKFTASMISDSSNLGFNPDDYDWRSESLPDWNICCSYTIERHSEVGDYLNENIYIVTLNPSIGEDGWAR